MLRKNIALIGAFILAMIMAPASSFAQDQIEVSGTITNSETEQTLAGVNIAIKGTNRGTSTDADGEYALSALPSDTLIFSFVGFETNEIPLQGRSQLDVEMTPKAVTGEEMVVVAFSEQSRKSMTNSVSSVNSEDIAKVPSSNLGNALSGQTPGLETIQRSGQPGGDSPEIYIRGFGSLSAGRSQPIYVLDGVVVRDARSITQLDPDNIENVSVLKDAAATAVYGVEGANGAIVVETKRGKQGDVQISLNTSSGFQTPTIQHEYADSYTHVRGFNEAQINDGVDPDRVRYPPEVVEAFRTGENPIIYPDMNWMDYLTKDRAFQSKTNLNISGGSENVQYFIAGGYLKQDGFFKSFDNPTYDVNPSFDRFNLRSNLDIDVTPSTHIALTAAGRVETQRELRGLNWTNVYRAVPFAGPGLIDGKVVVSGNEYIPGPKEGVMERYYGNGYNDHIKNAYNLDLSVEQQLDQFTEGLSMQLKGAYNIYFTEHKWRNSSIATYQPFYREDVDPSVSDDPSIVYQKNGMDDILQYGESYNRDRDWYVESRLNYNRDFGRHNVRGLLLYSQRKRYYPNSYTEIPRGLVSSVGRVNYNFDDRYMAEVSTGYNGSENFAKGNRFGFFPAGSVGWIVTNEPYMPDIPYLDHFKLRASYGIVGNDSGIGRFLYLPDQYNEHESQIDSDYGYSFGYNIPQKTAAVSEGALGNPNVKWEKSVKQNYGLDMRMFDDKLDLSVDYFYEHRSDILTTLNTVPDYVAANLPAVNIGEVENKGYEVEADWQHQVGDFQYNIGGHVTFARNKILEMDEVQRNEPYQERTGRRVGQRFGFIFDRFFTEEDIESGDYPEHEWNPKPGDLKFKDLNGDGVVDGDDQRAIGHPERPEYTFGADVGFRYKNFDLSTTWAAATNTSRTLGYVPFRTAFGPRGARSLPQWQWENRWTPEVGQDANYPRFSLNSRARRNNTPSDFWMRDASYVRLKNMEVGYTFSSSVLERFGLKNMRVYANGYNLLTFSKMMDELSIDPEQTANSFFQQYPLMRVYNFGLKLDL